jgi:hypothetical protein
MGLISAFVVAGCLAAAEVAHYDTLNVDVLNVRAISLKNSQGKQVMELGALEAGGGGVLRMCNGDGERKVVISPLSRELGGGAILQLGDDTDNFEVVAGTAGGTFATVKSDKATCVFMGTSPKRAKGLGFLFVNNAKGETIWTTPLPK